MNKNENVTADMIDILSELHKYVPCTQANGKLKSTVFLGGDQLTCERARTARTARVQAEDPKDRLEEFAVKIEDWHTTRSSELLSSYLANLVLNTVRA